MAMVDSRGPGAYQFPPRKPVAAPSLSAGNSTGPQLRNQIVPNMDFTASGRQGATSAPFSVVSRKDTPSSTSPAPSPFYGNSMNTTRRTPSNATSSTSNSTAVPTRTPSNVSSNLSRTASSRSGASLSPSSYVALMRKQKATVWCDRAQHEDPRILAQQKAAKLRAAREVSGGNMEGRTSTSGSMGSGSLGVRSKIRHHGVPKASGYHYPNLVGGGVPMRLSASEVGDEGNMRDDGDSLRNTNHQRTDSGRSSMGSNKWLAAANHRQSSRYSQGSIRTNGQGSSPNENILELEETPVPGEHQKQSEGDYFSPPASHVELETSFGSLGQMKGPTSVREVGKTKEDLRRRGSVDERSNTMGGLGGGRLFVANPDLSD
ncbi:hypothetical protein MMC29_005114 [Sticta canariensis]|nr:hypothetical protein [Sticta canariensis]